MRSTRKKTRRPIETPPSEREMAEAFAIWCEKRGQRVNLGQFNKYKPKP